MAKINLNGMNGNSTSQSQGASVSGGPVGLNSNGNSNIGSSGTPGPSPGTLHAQTKIRIEQIARYRIAGIRDFRIAEILKMSSAALKFITDKVEYKEVEEALLV